MFSLQRGLEDKPISQTDYELFISLLENRELLDRARDLIPQQPPLQLPSQTQISALASSSSSSGPAIQAASGLTLNSTLASLEANSANQTTPITSRPNSAPPASLLFSPQATNAGSNDSSRGSLHNLSHFSQQSGLSLASTLESVFPTTAKEILLSYELKEGGITIIVNKEQRPGTGISGSQGDHVTAYTILLQTICNLLEEDVQDAPNLLYKAAMCFLPDLKAFTFKNANDETKTVGFEEKCKEVKDQFFPRKVRKNLTNCLRRIQGMGDLGTIESLPLQEAIKFLSAKNSGSASVMSAGARPDLALNVELLRDAIKRSNRSLFAQFAVQVGEKLIREYNQLPTAAFPKLSKSKDSSEGNRVKNSMKNLRLLNKILQFKEKLKYIKDDNEQLKEEMADFKENCEQIIRASNPIISKPETFEKNFEEAIQKIFQGNKFKKKIQSVINKERPVEEVVTWLQAIEYEDISINVGELFNDLFDFKQSKIRVLVSGEIDGQLVDNGEKIALKDPLNCLYEVAARHLKFMFTAFGSLDDLPNAIKDNLILGFCNKIWDINVNSNGQGWSEWIEELKLGEVPKSNEERFQNLRKKIEEKYKNIEDKKNESTKSYSSGASSSL